MERFDIEVVENATKTANILPITPYEKVLASSMEDYLNYRKAEENGMLIHLPCRVGDTVYRIWTCGKSGRSIAEFRIEHIEIDKYPQIEFSYRCTKGSHSFYPYRFCKIEDFGKIVFLTREEAEQALKQMGE